MLVIVGIADYHNDDLHYVDDDDDDGSGAECGESVGTTHWVCLRKLQTHKFQ